MAKSKPKKKAAAKKSGGGTPKSKPKKKGKGRKKPTGGTHIANHGFSGNIYDCYGKRVNKRGGGTTPRIFCRRIDK